MTDVLEGETCPKCGSDDLNVIYHRDGHACAYRDRRSGGACREVHRDCCTDTEHLRVSCRRCQWSSRRDVVEKDFRERQEETYREHLEDQIHTHRHR